MALSVETPSPATDTDALHADRPTPPPSPKPARPRKSQAERMLDATLRFLSSVKVGVFLLAVLIVASVLGTVIIQKGTSGFTEYYASLLPAERELYEFLGLLDIYHTRWFNLLLLTVSLNIVLASIDYFPAAWRYVRKPVVKINQAFVSRQPFRHVAYATEAETALQTLKARAAQELRPFTHRWLPISAVYRVVETVNPRDGSITILTESHAWNRLTAYAVHAALLTIFGGALVGGLFGHKGTVRMVPGQSANTFVSFGAPDEPAQEFAMPFTLVCTDIEQNLLDPRKPDLSAPNTLDWHTRAIIRDEQRGVEVPAHIHLNHPFDYRGYRFFQASFDNFGSARTVNIELRPAGSPTGTAYLIGREPTDIPGLGRVRLADFIPDVTFQGGRLGSASGEYRRPVAILDVLGDNPRQLYAFPVEALETIGNAPFLKAKTEVGDMRLVMTDFEKVSSGHILQVQYDPGVAAVYLGSAMLIVALWLVFFFAHQRLWLYMEPLPDGHVRISLAGHTNRNRPAFEKRFQSIVAALPAAPGREFPPDSQPSATD
ncbi:cytochrome c biogenesis protein ResB [Chloracidobacterium sp. MS 40/45]|uniref:cytochrome c biogenesis protein ResB n=1 Tax=Chloracidobacterium aggregatum TaxID=2851959 RepID=UPI001B8C3B4C|nr:cytochrome c biogenesis protein ResB [Chloracidobacterium aggregatum]QUW00947.1 cytochrome c biogenesis protein ResB [Chloracidobacterium sp. MS 40/45]